MLLIVSLSEESGLDRPSGNDDDAGVALQPPFCLELLARGFLHNVAAGQAWSA